MDHLQALGAVVKLSEEDIMLQVLTPSGTMTVNTVGICFMTMVLWFLIYM
jgi:hypothetical protein